MKGGSVYGHERMVSVILWVIAIGMILFLVLVLLMANTLSKSKLSPHMYAKTYPIEEVEDFDKTLFNEVTKHLEAYNFECKGDYELTTDMDEKQNELGEMKEKRYVRLFVQEETNTCATIMFFVTKSMIRADGGTTYKKNIYKGFGLDTSFTDGVEINTICSPMPRFEDVHNAYRYVCCDIGHAKELIRMHLNKVKEISKVKTIDRSKSTLSIEERIDRESVEHYQKNSDTFIYHAHDDTYTIPFGKAVQFVFKEFYYELFEKTKYQRSSGLVISEEHFEYNEPVTMLHILLAVSGVIFLGSESYLRFISNGSLKEIVRPFSLISGIFVLGFGLMSYITRKQKS